MLTAALKRSREAFLDTHFDADDWRVRYFSGATYALWRAARSLMSAKCRGLVLDAGAGRGSWRNIVLANAAVYESLDVAPRGDHRPTWVGDVCDMPQVPDARFDTVVCHQVLEHVRRPWRALDELHRVLKPGGALIISVPHLNRRHELPHDYFRYTQEGLRSLLGDAGFVDTQVRHYGGTLCFLHHQFSFLLPGVLAVVPLLGTLAALLNVPLCWCAARADEILDRTGLIPLGVIAVAHKARTTAADAS